MHIQMRAQQRQSASINFEPIYDANRARPPAEPLRRRLPAVVGGLVLLAISTCNFLVNLNAPNAPFWDENYYVTAAARYAEGRAQFASHPPLGLMLISSGQALSGANRSVDVKGLARVKTVGDAGLPQDYQMWGPRLSSALFGVAIVLTLYGVLLAAGIPYSLAAASAALVAFDTAFVVQFRAAQLDAFQIEFALMCVGALALAAGQRPSLKRIGYFIVAGSAAGAATMVKLDGVLLCAALGAVIGPGLVRRSRSPRRVELAAMEGLGFATALLMVVCATYVLQTACCTLPLDYGAPAASTDARFMSPIYQHYLDGRLAWSPKVVAAAAQDSLRFMLNDQAGVGRWDPNGSSAWLQPLGVKPINYRWDSAEGVTRYVQLIPNPVTWAASGLSLAAAMGLLCARAFRVRGGLSPSAARSLYPIVAVAVVFYVAHGLLGAHRVMYLYHAFIVELLGILCLPFLVRALALHRPRWVGRIETLGWGLAAACVAAFAWFSPLAYHRPLTPQACELRNLPLKVVDCRE